MHTIVQRAFCYVRILELQQSFFCHNIFLRESFKLIAVIKAEDWDQNLYFTDQGQIQSLVVEKLEYDSSLCQ